MSDYDRWKTRSDRDDPAALNHREPDERDEFSVVQVFADGSHDWVREHVGAHEAACAAYHYTHNVAVKLGIGLVQRVMIVDGGDNCCFLWKAGEGVVFPPERS
jgi:hypothetical protein